MKYKMDNQVYNVVIERKHNKNTYIRIKEDMNIYVYTNFFITKSQINKILDENVDYIKKALEKMQSQKEKNEVFYYLGKNYDIILMKVDDVEIIGSNIYTTDLKMLDKWLKNQATTIFYQRLNYIYDLFEENIPYPNLKIRKMKTRWGVCNRKNNNVTLNFDLIKYDIDKIDYVIIHELSHFVYFDHSKQFWNLVGKYCLNYKKIRRELRG